MTFSGVRTRSQLAVQPERTRAESSLTAEENYETVRQEEPDLLAGIQHLKKYWKKLRGSHRDALQNGHTECDFPYWVLQNVSHDLIPHMLDIEYGKNTRAINFYGPGLAKHYGVHQWQFILFFGKLSQPKVKSLNKISKKRQDLRNFESLYDELKRIRSERVPFSHGPLTFEKVDFDTCANRNASHDNGFQNESGDNETSHDGSYHASPQSTSDDNSNDHDHDHIHDHDSHHDGDNDDDDDDDDDDWDRVEDGKGESSVMPIRVLPQRESSNRSTNSILLPGTNDQPNDLLEEVMMFDWATTEELPGSGEQAGEAPEIPESRDTSWSQGEELRTDTTTVSESNTGGEIQGHETYLNRALVSASPSSSLDRVLSWTRRETSILQQQKASLESRKNETWEHFNAEYQSIKQHHDYDTSSSDDARSSKSPDLSDLWQKYKASKKKLREHKAKRLKWNKSCMKLIQGLQEQIELDSMLSAYPHIASQE